MLWVGAPFAFALEYIMRWMMHDAARDETFNDGNIGRIEVINMIERVLTSHQSGARKVWRVAPMKKAGLWKSYLKTGFATFDRRFLGDTKFQIPVSSLARGQDGYPVLAATVSIRYHYGLQAANVSRTRTAPLAHRSAERTNVQQYVSLSLMQHTIDRALARSLQGETDERKMICNQAIGALIEDLKQLVHKTVSAETKRIKKKCLMLLSRPGSNSSILRSEVRLQASRSKALEEWTRQESGHFMASSARLLMTMGTRQGPAGETILPQEDVKYLQKAEVAKSLMKMVDPNVEVSFPAVRNGGFRSIITVTHSVLQRVHTTSSVKKPFTDWMVEGLAAAISSTGLHIFPMPTNINRASNPSLTKWGSIVDPHKSSTFRLLAADEPMEAKMQAALKEVIPRESQEWHLDDHTHHQLPFVRLPNEWKHAVKSFCHTSNGRGAKSTDAQRVAGTLLETFDLKKAHHHLFFLYGFMLARLNDIPILARNVGPTLARHYKDLKRWQEVLRKNPWVFPGDAEWEDATHRKGDVKGSDVKEVWLVAFVAGCLWFCEPAVRPAAFDDVKKDILKKLTSKKVNPLLLMKLGLLEPIKAGVRLVGSAREGTDFRPYPVDRYESKNEEAIKLCQKEGWYPLIKGLMGARVADMLVDDGKLVKNAGPPAGPSKLAIKRSIADLLAGGSDSEGEEGDDHESDDEDHRMEEQDDEDEEVEETEQDVGRRKRPRF